METSSKLNVKVDRQLVKDSSVDLPQFLDSVYSEMLRNFSLFGADDKFDIWPEEITLSQVVVYNGKTRKYTRAQIVVDEEKNVTGFKNIQEVRREWVSASEGVERQSLDTVLMERKSVSIWNNVLF